MNRFECVTKPLLRPMVFLLVAFVAGCGGGNGGPAGASAISGAPTGAVIPGSACTVAAGPAIPAVTASDPTNANRQVTTSTNGVAGGGKLITATFSRVMDPTTINAANFTLTPVGGAALVAASVSLDASGKVATFTTASALLVSTSYTAVIGTGAATLATPTPLACSYAFNFTTVAIAATGLAPPNLGLAAPFGIAATAGVTNTATFPITTINGNVVLDPTTTCNIVSVGAFGGFGPCGSAAPTINGQVISPLFPDAGISSGAIKTDLTAAFLSITPPAGPPAAGSLGGATSIAAGTTLGAPTGNALVQGDNLFVPGVYQSITSILITDDLTLDARGDTNAVFIFQSSSTVGTAAGAASPGAHTRILLINGAKASNVWWQAGTSATLGAFTEFQGNLLASANITMQTGASSCGRLLAGAFAAGVFIFDSNVVSVPGNLNAPPTCK